MSASETQPEVEGTNASEEKLREDIEYSVKENDSLRSIAVKFGNITPSQLAEYNNIASCGGFESLYVGQLILVPDPKKLKNHIPKRKSFNANSKPVLRNNKSVSVCVDSHYSIPIGDFNQNSEFGDTFKDADQVTEIPADYINLLKNEELKGKLFVNSKTLYFQENVPDKVEEGKDANADLKKIRYYFGLNFDSVTSFNTHTDLEKLISKNEKVLGSLPLKLPKPDENKSDILEDAVFIALCFSQRKIGSRPRSVSDSDPLAENGTDNFKELRVYHTGSLNFVIFRIPLVKFECICQIMLRQSLDESDDHSSMKHAEENKRDSTVVETALQDMEEPVTIKLINGKSTIFTEDMLSDLAENLPVHWYGSDLRYVYGSSNDGFSLSTIYRKARDLENAIVLVIRDTTGAAFGAIMSETMHCSNHFYGTGESCVFTWNKGFRVYNWTKKNYYFMRGSSEFFLIGAQSGHSAIWFDEALKYGRSEATETFDNPVLCGDSSEHSDRITALVKSSTSQNNSADAASKTHCKCPPGESMLFLIEQVELWEIVN